MFDILLTSDEFGKYFGRHWLHKQGHWIDYYIININVHKSMIINYDLNVALSVLEVVSNCVIDIGLLSLHVQFFFRSSKSRKKLARRDNFWKRSRSGQSGRNLGKRCRIIRLTLAICRRKRCATYIMFRNQIMHPIFGFLGCARKYTKRRHMGWHDMRYIPKKRPIWRIGSSPLKRVDAAYIVV